jgi:hypothetical protein
MLLRTEHVCGFHRFGEQQVLPNVTYLITILHWELNRFFDIPWEMDHILQLKPGSALN